MAHELVVLGAAFLLAAVLARLGARIGLPTIPLFMAAGIAMGPNTPGLVLFDHPEDLELLAAFGLIFLMFYLGVEFSIDDLVGGGRKLVYSAAIYLGLNFGMGVAFGFALGWGSSEAFVLAGIIGISSSAIVTKTLVELHRLENPETPLILGIIVIEDLFLALYLAALAPVLGQAKGTGEAVLLFAKAAAFLIAVVAIARFGTRVVSRLLHTDDDELLVVSFVGIALLVAGIAAGLGLSDAIGAFLAGLVIAPTTVAPRVRKLVLPPRDTFAAIFFFAFGLSVDPADATTVAVPALLAAAMSVVLTGVAGIAAARIHGWDRLAAANIGLTTLARGEFALILGALAVAAGLDGRISGFVALYVLVLAVASPILATRSATLSKVIPLRWVRADAT